MCVCVVMCVLEGFWILLIAIFSTCMCECVSWDFVCAYIYIYIIQISSRTYSFKNIFIPSLDLQQKRFYTYPLQRENVTREPNNGRNDEGNIHSKINIFTNQQIPPQKKTEEKITEKKITTTDGTWEKPKQRRRHTKQRIKK